MSRSGLTQTHAFKGSGAGQPLRSLRLEVVDGPDKGMSWHGPQDSVTIGTAQDNDLVLGDETVSQYHVELAADADRIHVVDQGSTNGTRAAGLWIVDGFISRGASISLGKSTVKVLDGDALQVDEYEHEHLHGIYGRSRSIRQLMARVEKAGNTDASVLLLGETGCGKEVVARAIHSASRRSDAPFEVVDCGALMPTLVASELFGHEKGAFTGANAQYKGAFERANGGTIFLDEIGELPAELQVRLLGVLERRSFRRLGGSHKIDVDVRVVSATHRDLRSWVNRGDFRQDLYYRIAVARLMIPALRERPEDIPILVEHFLRQMDLRDSDVAMIPPSTIEALQRYHWPGNVRELRNFVEAAVAFGEGPDGLEEADSESEGGSEGASTAGSSMERLFSMPYRDAREQAIKDFQNAYLDHVIAAADGNLSRAAELARMNRSHLMQLLKRLEGSRSK
ncbi:MAG: sigma 54-interacting transcriptional regulator [Myxococcota bacterium]